MNISVVIPTYHRNDLLCARALPSILRQTIPVAEIIIVHDGLEPDSVADLRAKVADFDDRRIAVYAIPRQEYPDDPGQRWCVLGLHARNFGLDLAQGEWIAPLDDDDEWTSDHLDILAATVSSTGCDFAYGKSRYHWPDGHEQWAGSWPPGMGAFCDGAQLYRNGMGYRYDPGCITRGLPEDGDLWTRMVVGGVTFAFAPYLVHHYYPNPR